MCCTFASDRLRAIKLGEREREGGKRKKEREREEKRKTTRKDELLKKKALPTGLKPATSRLAVRHSICCSCATTAVLGFGSKVLWFQTNIVTNKN